VDRFIAKTNFDSKWISNEYSRQLVHKWRAEEDAIMIGANTAIFDNPHLNVRDWAGQVRQPLRVVLDPDLKVPRSYHIFDGAQKTWIYNYKLSETDKNIQWKCVSRENFIDEILSDLYEAEILSVMVEGGSYLMNSLISKDLWDEARIFISDKTFGEGIKAPDLYHARLEEKRMVFNDELLLFKKSDD
jgi:diaminohydroxyphosphoribosylaminopyrimidine deaminase/5-amino-6-(5-phosphoribosylamino)uracil reductase